MVKFGKNKFKALNKIAKKQNNITNSTPNKVLKKKINVERKVTFQKEVLKEATVTKNPLVKNVSRDEVILNELSKKPAVKVKKSKTQEVVQKPKVKPVKKRKQRQLNQVNDTKMLLKLMK